jgi:hypothetical protein
MSVPTATNFTTTVSTVGASAIQLQGADTDGTALVFAVVAPPTHGTLSGLNSSTGAVVYSPDTGFVGEDSFTFNVTSGGETSATATVTVQVTSAKTRVTDKVLKQDGTPRKGLVTFILTQPSTSPGGLITAGSTVSAGLDVAGQFAVSLYPSAALSPRALYQLYYEGEGMREFLGLYDIPASEATIPLPGRITDANLAARYTFASVAQVESLMHAMADLDVGAFLGDTHEEGVLQMFLGGLMVDSRVSQLDDTVSINGALNVLDAVMGTLTVTGEFSSPTTDPVVAKVGANPSTPNLGLVLQGTGPGESEWLSLPSGGSSGSASQQQLDFYRFRNLLLEPLAIEPLQRGAFTYTVGATEYKVAISVWRALLDSLVGRFEIRDPAMAMPLRGVTLRGSYAGTGYGTGSHAVLLDPTRVSDADPQETLFYRSWMLNTRLATHAIGIDTGHAPGVLDALALVGAYGAIITQVTAYDVPWFVLVAGDGQWINLHDEMGDLTRAQVTAGVTRASGGNGVWRFGARPNMPVNKYLVAGARIGPSDPETLDVPAAGSMAWVNLPADWGKVPDATAYLFRDDMMSATLDTSKWTVFDITGAGTIAAIDTRFQWLKLQSDGNAWANVGVRSLATFTRAAGRTLEFDFVPASTDAAFAIGFANTTGGNVSDWAHAFEVDMNTGRVNFYEDGVNRANTGNGSILLGRISHCRIVLNADGSATYKVQGRGFVDGSNNAELGSTVWSTQTVPGSFSAVNTFRIFAHVFSGLAYVNDIKLF